MEETVGTSKNDNPETLATQVALDTKTKTNKAKYNTAQKLKKMRNAGLGKNGVNSCVCEW